MAMFLLHSISFFCIIILGNWYLWGDHPQIIILNHYHSSFWHSMFTLGCILYWIEDHSMI
jgi:hypothetical protein